LIFVLEELTMKIQTIAALTLPALLTAAHATPTGKIGFIGAKGAQVWNLRTDKTTTIPRSAKADSFTFSPRGDAVFFVPTGKKSAPPEQVPLFNGFLSRAPYLQTSAIPALQGNAPNQFHWSPSGNSLYFDGLKGYSVFTPATRNLKKLSFSPSGFDGPSGFDLKGRVMGYTTEKAVVIRDVETGKERVIFSINKPKPLFDALRRANNPKNVKDLLDGEEMLKDKTLPSYSSWQLAGPVLSPDGSRAYFASNAGTGFGAAGNGAQGYFSCNLKTGVISVLSKLSPSFGRPPEMSISPDGKRILAVSSIHSSAADNSSVALVIDLETQKSRELLYKIPGAKNHANFYGGSAWSPDGKYLALSAYFYDADKAFSDVNKNGEWTEPSNSAWKTAIFDATNGKIWKLKNGMRSPGWAR
jgi:hypothetical protein